MQPSSKLIYEAPNNMIKNPKPEYDLEKYHKIG